MDNYNGQKRIQGLLVGILIFSMGILGPGCASHQNTAKPTQSIPCESPRPELCTMDYTPVCGRGADNSQKTYSNACTACADKNIFTYDPGPCP